MGNVLTRSRGVSALAMSLAALPFVARADTAVEVEAKVISVREGRVYLKLQRPRGLDQAKLKARTAVKLVTPDGRTIKARLVAASSKYLVLEQVDGLEEGEDPIVLKGKLGKPPRRTVTEKEQEEPKASAPIQIGRSAPSQSEYQAVKRPERELVPFRGRAPEAPDTKPGDDDDDSGWASVDEEGNALTESGRVVNEVKGEIVLGADGVYDNEAGVSRTTPFGRMWLEVGQLFGNDRARFIFYGSVRYPFNGERDWTDNNKEQLIARFTHLAIELDAADPDQIESFADRIELGLGRSTVPAVTEAGLVDGMRFGMRFGAATVFGFGGLAASANPRREDFDSVIYGGGLRIEHSFTHEARLRLSVAAAQERFRDKGERDFVETQGAVHIGSFGAQGILVVDFFDTLGDRQDTRITTASLSAYWQVAREFRVEAGYRERRAQYQRELIVQDLDPMALGFLDPNARRNIWAGVRIRIEDEWTLWVRGEHFQGDSARDATGGSLGVSFRPERSHLVSLELGVRHRVRGSSRGRHTTDPLLIFSYSYLGEELMAMIALAYRDTIPDSVDDRRFALRGQLDYELGRGFGVRGYGEVDFRRAANESGVATYLGLAARYRF